MVRLQSNHLELVRCSGASRIKVKELWRRTLDNLGFGKNKNTSLQISPKRLDGINYPAQSRSFYTSSKLGGCNATGNKLILLYTDNMLNQWKSRNWFVMS